MVTSGCPNLALLDAILKSQTIANSQPPPNANPLTAAMTGFSNFSILFRTDCAEEAYLSAVIGSISTMYEISAPAQKDLSPAPVIITTLMLSSTPTMSIARDSSEITSVFIALRASGLLIRIVAMSSCGSTWIYFMLDIEEWQPNNQLNLIRNNSKSFVLVSHEECFSYKIDLYLV